MSVARDEFQAKVDELLREIDTLSISDGKRLLAKLAEEYVWFLSQQWCSDREALQILRDRIDEALAEMDE